MWMVIIAATIITFVYWGAGPNKSNPGGGGRVNLGSIGGEQVTPGDYYNALHEMYLRYFFNTGGRQWPDRDAKQAGFDVQRETYFRLLLIKRERDLNIHVSDAAVRQAASEILRSLGRGNAIPLDIFETQVLRSSPLNPPLTAGDFERFIRHDLGIQQLIATVGLSGRLVTPQEARAVYAREHEELSTEAVFFSASNYLAAVTTAPDAVAQFYTNRMADYRLNERVQVSYVAFGLSNHLAQAEEELAKTNLAELVEANYRQLGTNYYPDAKSPEEAKDRIRKEMIRRRAMGIARTKASEFAVGLFDMKPVRAENLETRAQSNGLAAGVSTPFASREWPKDIEVGADFTKAAFTLTADEPFAGPLDGADAAYVIALNRRLPSEVPPLERIRDQVTADYKLSQALAQARQAGEGFFKALTNGLAQGKTFADVCTETKARPVLVPPFSISTRELPEVENHASLEEFKQAAFTVAYGRPNQFVPTDEGGFVVFVHARLPLDEARTQAELPAFTGNLRQRRQNDAFNLWFRKQIEQDPGLRNILEELAKSDRQVSGTPQ
jgi:hypothetical protein